MEPARVLRIDASCFFPVSTHSPSRQAAPFRDNEFSQGRCPRAPFRARRQAGASRTCTHYRNPDPRLSTDSCRTYAVSGIRQIVLPKESPHSRKRHQSGAVKAPRDTVARDDPSETRNTLEISLFTGIRYERPIGAGLQPPPHTRRFRDAVSEAAFYARNAGVSAIATGLFSPTRSFDLENKRQRPLQRFHGEAKAFTSFRTP